MNTWTYPVLQLLAKAQTRQYRFLTTVVLTWEMSISSYRKTSQQSSWSMLPLFDINFSVLETPYSSFIFYVYCYQHLLKLAIVKQLQGPQVG